MTDSTSPSQDSKINDALPWLDRILNLQYALLFVSLVLAIDIARTPLHALGFPTFEWRNREISVGLGTTLVFTTGYVLFMVGLSPMLQAIVEMPLRAADLSDRIARFLNLESYRPNHEERYCNGQVAVYEAQPHALKERDELWIKRIDAHRARAERLANQTTQLARFSFACMVLILAELAVADPTSWIHAAFDWMFSVDGRLAATVKMVTLATLAFIVSTPWILNLGRDPSDLRNGFDWIEHPELAAKLLQERRSRVRQDSTYNLAAKRSRP